MHQKFTLIFLSADITPIYPQSPYQKYYIKGRIIVKKAIKLGCGIFLFGSLLLSGCGNNEPSNTMVSLATLYQSAGMEAKYTINFEQESQNVVDDLIVHQMTSLNEIESMQKKIDTEKEQAVAQIKEKVQKYYHDQYNFTIHPQKIFWDAQRKSYVLFNRPTKFYLLTPNSDGKFGDDSTPELKELTFPTNDEFEHETLEAWGELFWPTFGIGSAKVWDAASQEFTFLWSKDQLYIMSGIHDDKKNHNSICILARPGDITNGMKNGTFPFKEDITFELLAAYTALVDKFLPAYTFDLPFPEVFVPESDTDKVMLGKKSGYLILSSIKKQETTNTYTTYSGDILWADGKWAGSPARPAYVRFYKDGHKEYSVDNQDYFTDDTPGMWKDFGDLISRQKNL